MAPEWLDGFDLAYQEWSLWIWFLNAFALYCAVGFVYFWFRLHGLKRKVDAGLPYVGAFNRALEGFPNAVFAKMMGFAPLEPRDDGAEARRSPGGS